MNHDLVISYYPPSEGDGELCLTIDSTETIKFSHLDSFREYLRLRLGQYFIYRNENIGGDLRNAIENNQTFYLTLPLYHEEMHNPQELTLRDIPNHLRLLTKSEFDSIVEFQKVQLKRHAVSRSFGNVYARIHDSRTFEGWKHGDSPNFSYVVPFDWSMEELNIW